MLDRDLGTCSVVIGGLLCQFVAVHRRQAGDGSLVSQMTCEPKVYVFPWTTNRRGYWAPSPIISINALEKINHDSFGLILITGYSESSEG